MTETAPQRAPNAGPPVLGLDALAAEIPDGALLAVAADYSGVSMAATHALLRRGVRDLRLFCLPYSTTQADMLIGAGCVAEVEAAAVTLGEAGRAPRFSEAVEQGRIVMRDSTCPALHAALQASEKGVPFIPLRGLIGSDILAHRPDWRVIDNPFAAEGDPIVLIPAVQPDIALFHATKADSEGNVWIGRRRELATMVHASRRTLVTVEEVVEGSFYDDEATASGVLPALYVDAIAEAPGGALPCGLQDLYDPDAEAIVRYARAARTAEGFAAYMADLGLVPAAAAE
jgi:glutaconate CoA-transferase subunit A